ncbi:MAG: DUF111 family protein [Proteobacteria bacterium]|nr:DUF111 family protein [Pseudomonadota bacterium]
MTCAYVDCFAGISGDMMLGTLVDLGMPVDLLQACKSLGMPFTFSYLAF